MSLRNFSLASAPQVRKLSKTFLSVSPISPKLRSGTPDESPPDDDGPTDGTVGWTRHLLDYQALPLLRALFHTLPFLWALVNT
eukprot:4803187-Karenia_brevis.AAC.1